MSSSRRRGSSPRTTRAPRSSTGCSMSSPTGCGRSRSRSPPTCRRRRPASWLRSGSPWISAGRRWPRARRPARPGSRRRRRSSRGSRPRAPRRRDRHARAPRRPRGRRRRARARPGGGGDAGRLRRDGPRLLPGDPRSVRAARGRRRRARHPSPRRRRRHRERRGRAPKPARPSEGRRRGGDRARLLPRPRAAGAPGRTLPRAGRARRGGRQAGRRPYARGGRGHGGDPRGRPGRPARDPALLLLHEASRAGAGARLVRVFRRQRHISEGGGAPALGGPRSPGTAAGRDGQPVPLPAAGPREAERARARRAHARRARGRPRRGPRRARAGDRRERVGPVRASVSVRPKRELGQHWLVDENILGVVGRLAELDRDDVVLEVGPGLGVLTAYLADRARLVHAIELDRSLEGPLRERLGGRENVELVFGDALERLGGDLDPAPTKLVSNLPYNVATPIVVETVVALPTVTRWCVMVQREVAARFFAEPGTKEYGGVTVVLRLATERTGLRPVARTCFRPPPNVDSALVAFRRVRLVKEIPVAAGLGGGSADAAAALRLANETLFEPLAAERLCEVAGELGSDVPFFLDPGPKLAEGAGERLTPLDLPQDYWVVVAVPRRARKSSTGAVYERFDELGGGAGFAGRKEALLDVLAAVSRPRHFAGFPPNDLARAAAGEAGLAGDLLAAGAFRADLSGAGPAVYGLFH